MPAGKRLPALNEIQFLELQSLVEHASGVILLPDRRAVITARLARRLRHYQLAIFADYLHLLTQPGQHYELLAHWLAEHPGPTRLWSAVNDNWRILASDMSPGMPGLACNSAPMTFCSKVPPCKNWSRL
ncbi:hypothetical protein [Pseudomonas fluorescens]|uniref:hypothetical protein n=1 Tax=Pseudomonas fluorescens TaxID=294 RepID=UPI00177E420F|nr:hypothetical protein [Pseudomonas fluorescens]